MRAVVALVFAVWSAWAFSQPAHAEKRVALVIGNSAYQKVGPLANPANDASAIAATFQSSGFDVVELKRDLNVSDMRRALRDFSDTVRDADIAIVYFAGHGIEIDGTNYMVPVDAALERDIDAFDEAVPLERILTVIEPAKKLRLVILDACRDNPFSRIMKRTIGARSIERGLAKVEPTSPNTLVAYAAKAGSTASDGDSKNSPFTAALIKYLPRPGLDLRKAFGFARDDVLKATNNRQEPFIYGSLGGDDVALVPASTTLPVVSADPNASIRRDYEFAERIGTKPVWDSFISNYPSGFYSDLARAQRGRLEAASGEGTDKTRKRSDNSDRVAANDASVGDSKVREEKSNSQLAALPPTAEAAANDVTRDLETELVRVGCRTGTMDGSWNAAAQQSLQLFNRNAGTKLDIKVASLEALETVRGKTARVCPLNCRAGYEMGDDGACRRIEVKKPAKPVASVTPSDAVAPRNNASSPAIHSSPKEYQPMGSGKVSDGSCTCKSICNKFASSGQLSGAKLGQCKSDCEQKFAGCNRGALR